MKKVLTEQYGKVFALAFAAPYIASEKKISPETVQEMIRRSLYFADGVSKDCKKQSLTEKDRIWIDIYEKQKCWIIPTNGYSV